MNQSDENEYRTNRTPGTNHADQMNQPDQRALALAEARRRFIRLAQITAGVTVVALIAGFSWFRATNTPFSGPFVIAVVVGVVGSMMIAAALMGLTFFSATSGVDDDADSSDF